MNETRSNRGRHAHRPGTIALLLTLGALLAFIPSTASAQKLKCKNARRCPVRDAQNNILAGQCTIQDHNDPQPKGGYWKFSCTNKSAFGNFSWEYTNLKNGVNTTHKMGKCIYDQGRNVWNWQIDPTNPKQYTGFKDINTSRKTSTVNGQKVDNGEGNDRTIWEFSKASNSGTCIKESRTKNAQGVPGPWTEVSRRTYSDVQDLITSGFIANDAPPDNHSTFLTLLATRTGSTTVDLRWSAFEESDPSLPSPVLHSGDSVYLDSLQASNVLVVAPGFTPSTLSPGMKLTANTNVTLGTGTLLATIRSTAAAEMFFSVNVQNSLTYFQSVLGGAPVQNERFQQPDYASTAGTVDVSDPFVPSISDWTAVILALSLAGIAFSQLRRTQRRLA